MSRYKPVGWRGESQRHSLARKGIKTSNQCKNYKVVGAGGRKYYHKIPEGTDIYKKYYSIKNEDGELSLSLGNLSDAGWYWNGDERDMLLFLERIRASINKNDFLMEMKKRGIRFDTDIREQIIKNLEKDDDGIYALSGDNLVWKFGEGDDPYIDDDISDLGLSSEKEEEFKNKFWDNYKGLDYDDFLEERGKDVKKKIIDVINKSYDFNDLFDNMKDLKDDIMIEDVFNYQDELKYEAIEKTRKELGV